LFGKKDKDKCQQLPATRHQLFVIPFFSTLTWKVGHILELWESFLQPKTHHPPSFLFSKQKVEHK
jgi:hypothetical protein